MHPLKDITRFPSIHQRCIKLGLAPNSVEQEVALSADMKNFVQTGSFGFSQRPASFIPAFSLNLTGIPAKFLSNLKGGLWTTRDFAETVISFQSLELDFLRPVQWVLSTVRHDSNTSKDGVFVLISPYEANELLPDIRRCMKVQLHVFTPRLTLEMTPCDDLRFFTIPPIEHPTLVPTRIRMELILFSGQLYLSSYDDYIEFCKFLGVFANDLRGLPELRVSHDGFINSWDRPSGIRTESAFSINPIRPVTALMSARLNGTSFSHTHIGKILSGRLLFPEEFGLSDEDSAA